MVNRPRDFRHHDVVRGIRAARAAGVENPSVRIRTPTGTEYFFGGEVKGASETRGRAARASVSKGRENRAPLAEGGKAHMLGKQAADTAPPGRTAKTKSAAAPKEASVGGAAFPAKPA
jgi:hypothetical protein